MHSIQNSQIKNLKAITEKFILDENLDYIKIIAYLIEHKQKSIEIVNEIIYTLNKVIDQNHCNLWEHIADIGSCGDLPLNYAHLYKKANTSTSLQKAALLYRSVGDIKNSNDCYNKSLQIQLSNNEINRITCVNRIIKQTNKHKYLEIGVLKGHMFHQIHADRKTAVDPNFMIPGGIKNSDSARYFPLSSNDFFQKNNDKFDIIFIDGLHSHDQSLKDAINAINCLEINGIIVMHDCLLTTDGVWKTIIYLRSLVPNIDVFVLDADHGLGIIRIISKKCELNLSQQEVENITLEKVLSDKEYYLNLKPSSYFDEFLKTLT